MSKIKNVFKKLDKKLYDSYSSQFLVPKEPHLKKASFIRKSSKALKRVSSHIRKRTKDIVLMPLSVLPVEAARECGSYIVSKLAGGNPKFYFGLFALTENPSGFRVGNENFLLENLPENFSPHPSPVNNLSYAPVGVVNTDASGASVHLPIAGVNVFLATYMLGIFSAFLAGRKKCYSEAFKYIAFTSALYPLVDLTTSFFLKIGHFYVLHQYNVPIEITGPICMLTSSGILLYTFQDGIGEFVYDMKKGARILQDHIFSKFPYLGEIREKTYSYLDIKRKNH